jgi:hypothetical protein
MCKTRLICRISVATHFSALLLIHYIRRRCHGIALHSSIRFFRSPAASHADFPFARSAEQAPLDVLRGKCPRIRKFYKSSEIGCGWQRIPGAPKYVSDSRRFRVRSNIPLVFPQLQQ